MNIANRVTIVRLILTPIGVGILFLPLTYRFLLSIGCFTVAVVTDFLDGYLSRRLKIVTRFGAHLDIIADKVLLLAYLFVLQLHDIYPLWLISILVAREAVIVGYLALVRSPAAPHVLLSAKIKVVFQGVSIWIGLLSIAVQHELSSFSASAATLQHAAVLTMLVAMLLGFLAPWSYLRSLLLPLLGWTRRS